ncbi:hypothetical protein EJ08DRAFT_656450 [Tothia fuscella]|uniref:BZIP domain-containing protein n=1 Tax=Tothia fuscella TaxID=1048955 RepID=A0A9P4P2H2_9PEZI|nr:hypothetical protein EJ08DRAFT_656450 [Tothia fuscella]
MSSHDHFSSGSESRTKGSTPGAKRRPSRAGTRSVSTLTSAQLERKRANDREAQRAIRQRTKDHIDQLERRIAELSATNDTSAKLMQALQRNEELEQENALLRSRLNHAVAAMSEGGMSSEMVGMPPGPTSPNRRMKISTQIRTSSTPVPRSVPTPNVPQGPMPPHEAWQNAYSPVSSTIERSPSLADVSPATSNLRWGPPHAQVSPSIPEPERNMHQVDPNSRHQPVSYNYVLDASGRPMQYQPEGQLMSGYPPATSPGGHMTEYHGAHSNAQMAPAPAPSYTQYAAPPNYLPASPHESEPMPLMHRPTMESQQLMYNMPSNMKSEQ